MNLETEMEPWIFTSERLPEDGASVAFVVKSSGRLDYLNGRVLGGIYRANKYIGGFGIPGLALDASAWMPLPPPPPNTHYPER
jgi:hypothetical protein